MPVSSVVADLYIEALAVQGDNMSDFSALDPYNWRAAASLVIQLAFLIGGVWFASNLLKTMRAFQDQIGALLKLSITGVTAERLSSTDGTNLSPTQQSPYWLAPSESETAALPQPTESGPGRFAVGRRKMVLWLQTPMSSTHSAPWRRIITWLQAPARS